MHWLIHRMLAVGIARFGGGAERLGRLPSVTRLSATPEKSSQHPSIIRRMQEEAVLMVSVSVQEIMTARRADC